MRDAPRVLLVMGVSGSGKSTIGAALAKRLGWRFIDADDYHSASNRAKLAAGVPLSDDDRRPWLATLAREIDTIAAKQRLVVACSALHRSYRAMLRHGRQDFALIYLDGSAELIAAQLRARRDHFMSPSLLDSQFAALQPPAPDEDALIVPIDRSVAAIVEAIVTRLPQLQGQPPA